MKGSIELSIPPGYEWRIIRGREPLKHSTLSVLLYKPRTDAHGLELCGMASREVHSNQNPESVCQGLIRECARQAGIDA